MQHDQRSLVSQTMSFTVGDGLTIRGEAWGVSDAPPVDQSGRDAPSVS